MELALAALPLLVIHPSSAPPRNRTSSRGNAKSLTITSPPPPAPASCSARANGNRGEASGPAEEEVDNRLASDRERREVLLALLTRAAEGGREGGLEGGLEGGRLPAFECEVDVEVVGEKEAGERGAPAAVGERVVSEGGTREGGRERVRASSTRCCSRVWRSSSAVALEEGPPSVAGGGRKDELGEGNMLPSCGGEGSAGTVGSCCDSALGAAEDGGGRCV